MGYRFSLQDANWMAHVLGRNIDVPDATYNESRNAIGSFVESFRHNFFPSSPHGYSLMEALDGAVSSERGDSLRKQVAVIKDYFSDVPWFALLLPSGEGGSVDRLLTSRRFLRELVLQHPDEAGVILQIDRYSEEAISLQNVFPAFKVALSEATRWPGVLLWTPSDDAIFLELTKHVDDAGDRLNWIFDRLFLSVGNPNLNHLKHHFLQEFDGGRSDSSRTHIVHLSDLHLGSKLARRRMDRIQTIIKTIVAELGDDERIIPVLTGDLMDTPSEENLGDLRAFMVFIRSLGIDEPVVTIGNHDVRDDGWLNPNLYQAINIPQQPVVWIDEAEIAFACFNSVNSGVLAQGEIGEAGLTNVGNALDQHPNKRSYTLLAALHHHPIPVETPDWYRRTWYEKLFGGQFDRTEALRDSSAFLSWLKVRNVSAVLHGHKHIPRFDIHDGVAVIGCGSSIGKVDTAQEGQTYMSVNLVTIDRTNSSLSCRLRAERVPGAGLENIESHEMVLRNRLV